jgi:hypothetical protein
MDMKMSSKSHIISQRNTLGLRIRCLGLCATDLKFGTGQNLHGFLHMSFHSLTLLTRGTFCDCKGKQTPTMVWNKLETVGCSCWP